MVTIYTHTKIDVVFHIEEVKVAYWINSIA